MSEIPGVITIRRRYVPWVCGVFIAGCVTCGLSGAYSGMRGQEARDAAHIDQLHAELAQQKIAYEQRLGQQSAQYAIDATNFGNAVHGFSRALDAMRVANDRRAAEREHAQAQAILAAERAANTAQAILATQAQVQKQVSETAKKLDTATLPVAATPRHEWGK